MSVELQMLGATAALGVIQLFLALFAANTQRDAKWAGGPRDTPAPPLTGVPARLNRAYTNLLETLPLFVAAVVAAELSQRTGGLACIGAQVYFWARVLHLPVYAAGIPTIRFFVWLTSMAGIGLVLLALVPAVAGPIEGFLAAHVDLIRSLP